MAMKTAEEWYCNYIDDPSETERRRMVQMIQLIQADALESAAKVCDAEELNGDYYTERVAGRLASEIRALKPVKP